MKKIQLIFMAVLSICWVVASGQCPPASYSAPLAEPSVHYVHLQADATVPQCALNSVICSPPGTRYTSADIPGTDRKWIRLSGWTGQINAVWMDSQCNYVVHQQCLNLAPGGIAFWVVVLDYHQPLHMVIVGEQDTIRIDRRSDQGTPGTQMYPQLCTPTGITAEPQSAQPARTYTTFDPMRGATGKPCPEQPPGLSRRSDGKLTYR